MVGTDDDSDGIGIGIGSGFTSVGESTFEVGKDELGCGIVVSGILLVNDGEDEDDKGLEGDGSCENVEEICPNDISSFVGDVGSAFKAEIFSSPKGEDRLGSTNNWGGFGISIEGGGGGGSDNDFSSRKSKSLNSWSSFDKVFDEIPELISERSLGRDSEDVADDGGEFDNRPKTII